MKKRMRMFLELKKGLKQIKNLVFFFFLVIELFFFLVTFILKKNENV